MKKMIDRLYKRYLENQLNLIYDSGDSYKTKLSFIRFIDYKQVYEFKNGIARVLNYTDGYNYINENGDLLLDEWVDTAKDFEDGVAIVEKRDGKYALINEKGKFLGKHEFDYIGNFENGYAIVNYGFLYNYIDKKGRLISGEYFRSVYPFVGDYAKVTCQNGEKCLIDKNGRKVFRGYDYVDDFYDGFAVVKKDNRYNYIDTNGNLISKKWFVSAERFTENTGVVRTISGKYGYIDKNKQLHEFKKDYLDVTPMHGGYFIVEYEHKSTETILQNYIDINEKKLLPEGCSEAKYFSEGFGIIENENGFYNYVDEKGNTLIDWCDECTPFKNGYATIKNGHKYTLIDNRGRRVLKDSYDDIDRVSDNLWLVRNWKDEGGCEYNFINKDGEETFSTGVDEVFTFVNGYAIVKRNNEYNYVSTNGKLISTKWYKKAYNFYKGRAIVFDEYDDMLIIDEFGNMIEKNYYVDYLVNNFTNDYAEVRYHSNVTNYLNLDGNKIYDYDPHFYNVKKRLFKKGFKFTIDLNDKKVKYNIKYYPIKTYGTRYVLCTDEDFICFLYDSSTKEYKKLYSRENIIYDDNFLFYDKKVYFMYNNKMIDITDYYKRHLYDKSSININPCYELLERSDFEIYNSKQIKELMDKEAEKERKRNAQKEIEKKQKKIKEQQELRQKEILETKNRIAFLLKGIKEYVDELKTLSCVEDNIGFDRINIENIFIEINGHKEIPNYIKNSIYLFDLTGQDFRMANVQGIDFRGCKGLQLFPEEVYNKDLRNCDFRGLYLEGIRGFHGVDIRGAKFSIDKDPGTYDIMPSFIGAIYDETTTYNGTPLTELIGPCKELEDKEILYGNNRI